MENFLKQLLKELKLKGGESMLTKEMFDKLVFNLYSRISKELEEKGLTEEVLKAINTLMALMELVYPF